MAQAILPITLPGAMPGMQASSIFSSLFWSSETSRKSKQNTTLSPVKQVVLLLPDAPGVGGCGDNSDHIDICKPTVIVTLWYDLKNYEKLWHALRREKRWPSVEAFSVIGPVGDALKQSVEQCVFTELGWEVNAGRRGKGASGRPCGSPRGAPRRTTTARCTARAGGNGG
ncbi:unnamed protein product [Prorocentrum cordatum]|uniref:Uncharacterized protein n=1 Tax=Prorocentrum cordatum TaxID=2364126 RepID=A0ABN9R655_9DINO|nr:unnamed protein product [Polarella glacialis]